MSAHDEYHITDWAPPWIDNGERLAGFIEFLRESDDPDMWKVSMVLLGTQLDLDLAEARAGFH